MTVLGAADTLGDMKHAPFASRTVFLALSLLSACAASDASGNTTSAGAEYPAGAFGQFLAGRFAMAAADPDAGATALSKAVALAPNEQDLIVQAFLANLAAERPEALSLARRIPDNQIAQLVLADDDIRAGRWEAAEKRYHGLPRQGLTQLLQPLLVAWAQQGAGHTDAALTTLRPFAENPRFRGIFALHAAMIADLADRRSEAEHYYEAVRGDASDTNLRLAQILASWLARSGQPDEARQLLTSVAARVPEIRIALRDLLTHIQDRPVANVQDGIAETYVALAAALRAQDQNDLGLLMLHLAFRVRPDFSAARLLQEEIQTAGKNLGLALKAVDAIPSGDPMISIARLRRAGLLAQLDRTEDAIEALKRVSADYPDNAMPDIQLGDILRVKRRFEEAISAYTRAIGRIDTPEKSDWAVFYDRGVAYERAGKWPLAEADLKLALQLSPGQPFVLNYLGYSWADMGRNLPLAREMIQAAAAARQNDGAVTDSLGWVMFRLGDVANAVRALERAVELEPEDSTITDHLGDVYYAAGRKLEARYEWKRALTLNPAPEEIPKLEEKLKNGPAKP
jgi:tetratricopeptide (TPR) repeat protein